MNLEDLVQKVASHKGDIGIGRITDMVKRLNPTERGHVMAGLDYLDNERDLGRHGSKDPLGDLEIDKSDYQTAERIYEARRNDYIAEQVIERRGGPDTDRPLPPLTSRDMVAAAFDLHSGE